MTSGLGIWHGYLGEDRQTAMGLSIVANIRGHGVIYVAHGFGSAAYGLTTGVCKIMAAAALVAWQVGASRTWSHPALTAGPCR